MRSLTPNRSRYSDHHTDRSWGVFHRGHFDAERPGTERGVGYYGYQADPGLGSVCCKTRTWLFGNCA